MCIAESGCVWLCTGEDGEEGPGAADEPAQVRENGGYGQHDLPQRGIGAAQPAIALLLWIHLRQLTSYLINSLRSIPCVIKLYASARRGH